MSNKQPQRSTKSLSLAKKLQIIELHKFSNKSQNNIAKTVKCSKSQIHTTLENREHYLKLQLRRNETVAPLNEIPSTSTQQQSLGATTTTSTTSLTSTAKDAGLYLKMPHSKKILSLAEQCQIIELRKTSDITHKALATQFGCSIGHTAAFSLLKSSFPVG
jgi:transposase-like protein